jgi:transcriptional regulator with XRE-family HTH domain
MTLTVLAGLCGVSPAYLSMVENGKRKLDRWSTIVALANGLRIPPAELALDDPAGSRAEVKEAN